MSQVNQALKSDSSNFRFVLALLFLSVPFVIGVKGLTEHVLDGQLAKKQLLQLYNLYGKLGQENRQLKNELCDLGKKEYCQSGGGPVNPGNYDSGGPVNPGS